MIIDKKDARKELLYTAYGYAVEGIKATYIYTYDGSNREEDCLTSLYITDVEGKEIYTYKGFNNPISCTCFEKNIDCFLWWIQHDTPGNYDIKKTFNDVFVNNRGIFSHRIIQMKHEFPWKGGTICRY